MEYEEMRQMEKTHCCAQCETRLITIWDDDFGQYQLICGAHKEHRGYMPIPSLSQALARGQADNHLGKGAQKGLEKMAAEGVPALSKLPDKDLGSGVAVAMMQLLPLIEWGSKLGLKPYLGHVCLYFGKPYVTIDGYYYLAAKLGRNYRVGTRPLNTEERTAYQVPEGSYAWLAEVWLYEVKLPTTGLGIVTKEEIEGKSARKPEEFRAPVVHSHPQRMAEKRAEWQLLRKLIPLEEVDIGI